SMAIDRDTLAGTFGVPRWRSADRLLPAQLDSASPPVAPVWAGNTLAERQAAARAQVAEWTRARGSIEPLRVALPAGPGMRILFARVAADWRAIGVPAVLVAFDAKDADLRLIDEVAPNASANWYLTRTGCDFALPCAFDADAALKASRAAPSFAARAVLIGQADAAQAKAPAFIPLARPVRWSLVDPALEGFHENAFATHPLAELVVRAQ
ncbi:MAG: ABC transporter substrate-binding protein, partial [Sphingomonadaceae bacterium]|nr:ABC transporter substrate-binding protein [Sphingomonadaceae bacterium]